MNPWGSHIITDPLLSSSKTTTIHHGTEFDRIQKECGNIINKFLQNDEFIDCIPLGEDEISEYMKKQMEPFYKK